MSLLLDIGNLNNPLPSVTAVGTVLTDNTPSERVIYPHKQDQSLLVAPGRMVVITAYIKDRQQVNVEKLLLSNGIPVSADGVGCCLTNIKGAETTILNRVIIPSKTLTTAVPVRVIDIPGVYHIKPISDEDGDIVITAMDYPAQVRATSMQDELVAMKGGST